MALGETPYGKRHRRSRQHYACQCGQTEKFFRTLESGLDFRTGIANPLYPFPKHQMRLGPSPEILHIAGFSGNQKTIADPATLLHQTGCG